MKKLKLIIALVLMVTLFGCSKNIVTEAKKSNFDNPATEIDHYFGNQISFADTNTTLGENKFIANKVAKLKLKSVTDGDTAIFYLDKEQESFTSPIGKSSDTITVRFLNIDTPESTSAIDPWGKAASSYVRGLLSKATGIIVDATDVQIPEGDDIRSSSARRDSNGTRWLALIWYTNDADTNDYSKYRLLQLDVIEECYSRYTGTNTEDRSVYSINKDESPKLFNRYKEQFGGMRISDVLYEAEDRMGELGLRRIGNQVDPNYDYSKTPTEMTIEEAIKNFDEYESKGKFVALTGVITRFIGPNFYMEDANGYAIYVYMGINGASLEGPEKDQFMVGDTINIRGRLAEYGGQKQLSGVVFKQQTFKKITDPEKMIPLPTATVLTGNETMAELEALIGKLVVFSDKVDSLGSESKDLSYTIYLEATIKELEEAGAKYDNFSIRVNGSLAPGYLREDMKSKGNVKVTGVMSIYFEIDYTLPEDKQFPSYQIVVGNKQLDEEGKLIDEIVYS